MLYRGQLRVFNKKSNLCDKKSKASELLQLGFGLFAIPSACLFKASPIFCYQKEVVVKFTESTLRLMSLFPVNGNSAIAKLIISHDTGKSCFETEIELVKA